MGAGTGKTAALGWSLGGEAHVFLVGDRQARALYESLTGRDHLTDSLAARPLIAVAASGAATILSANGAAPARLTLARFHAPAACGQPQIVTELVFAFPAGGAAGRSTPSPHATVVALVGEAPFAGGAGSSAPALPRARALALVTRVAQRAEPRATLLAPLQLDPDRAADAGEVLPLPRLRNSTAPPRYAVGFRARFQAGDDTVLVTGVADADTAASSLRWIVRPATMRLDGGMIRAARHDGRPAVRYSLRGVIAGRAGRALLLLDEIADVSARVSRATAVDPATRRVVAAKPLALRCP